MPSRKPRKSIAAKKAANRAKYVNRMKAVAPFVDFKYSRFSRAAKAKISKAYTLLQAMERTPGIRTEGRVPVRTYGPTNRERLKAVAAAMDVRINKHFIAIPLPKNAKPVFRGGQLDHVEQGKRGVSTRAYPLPRTEPAIRRLVDRLPPSKGYRVRIGGTVRATTFKDKTAILNYLMEKKDSFRENEIPVSIVTLEYKGRRPPRAAFLFVARKLRRFS